MIKKYGNKKYGKAWQSMAKLWQSIKKYCNKSRLLLFNEIDSLMYEIETEDLYKDYSKIRICLI